MLRLSTFVLASVLAFAPAQADERPATISLTGQGQVSATPDIATLYVGVDSREDTAAAALAANSEQAARVIETLKGAGVASKDIQTANFSVSPIYDNRKSQSTGRPEIDGYQVSNQVIARVRDLDGLGGLLDQLVGAGANRIGGISFGVEDDAEARDKARALAVEDARHKAGIYAAAAGVQLGPILSISEGGARVGPQDFGVAMRAESAMAAPVERGQATISAQVSIVWRIAQP